VPSTDSPASLWLGILGEKHNFINPKHSSESGFQDLVKFEKNQMKTNLLQSVPVYRQTD
jgi:hypothetical protein